MANNERFALLNIIDITKNLIKVFQHGPGPKKFPIVGYDRYYDNSQSNAFCSYSGTGFLAYSVVASQINHMKYYLNTYLAIK